MHQFIFWILLLFGASLQAQSWQLIQADAPFFYRYVLASKTSEQKVSLPSQLYSSWVIRSESINQIGLLFEQEVVFLKLDPHADSFPNKEQSILYLNAPADSISLIIPAYQGIELLLFYAPPLAYTLPNQIEQAGNCEMPPATPQAVWRAGLPPPSVLPTSTSARHLIVHHSAGSNTDSDPIALVRNIYLLHTNGNGWDDIGYNYLIARNGQVFLGRDPQGVAAQDAIRGAHFCGKNSLTMGVCLLGDYTASNPPDLMMASLRQLLVWKLNKEKLDAQQSSMHPPGDPNALAIYHVDGHRSGCATECPGSRVFARLSSFRDTLNQEVARCQATRLSTFASSKPKLYLDETLTYVLSLEEPQQVQWQIFQIQGQLLEAGNAMTSQLHFSAPASISILHIRIKEHAFSYLLLPF